MHVGYSIGPQNPDDRWVDADVLERELRLLDLAVELGFESVWTVEHHFTEYLLSPDPVQLLTWLGARHPRVRLGTGVIVLPWHQPVRCAEQIALLDNLTGGRLVLGLGRGISRIEYEGFGVDMSTSRERFVATARARLRRRDVARGDAADGAPRHRPARDPTEALAGGAPGPRRVLADLARDPRGGGRAAGAALRRDDLRRPRSRARPRLGGALHRRLLPQRHEALRVPGARARGRPGLRVLRQHQQAHRQARRRRRRARV